MSDVTVFLSGTIGFQNETNVSDGVIKEVRIYPTNRDSQISTESDTQIFEDVDSRHWEVGFKLLPFNPVLFAPLSYAGIVTTKIVSTPSGFESTPLEFVDKDGVLMTDPDPTEENTIEQLRSRHGIGYKKVNGFNLDSDYEGIFLWNDTTEKKDFTYKALPGVLANIHNDGLRGSVTHSSGAMDVFLTPRVEPSLDAPQSHESVVVNLKGQFVVEVNGQLLNKFANAYDLADWLQENNIDDEFHVEIIPSEPPEWVMAEGNSHTPYINVNVVSINDRIFTDVIIDGTNITEPGQRLTYMQLRSLCQEANIQQTAMTRPGLIQLRYTNTNNAPVQLQYSILTEDYVVYAPPDFGGLTYNNEIIRIALDKME